MFELPVELEIDGKLHPIRNRGDFRMVLDCFAALNEVELDDADRILSSLIIFYDELSGEDDVYTVFGDAISEAVTQMMSFFNCGEVTVGSKQNYRLVDWQKDSQLIASAINKSAGMEIRSLDYLHWWTFMGYYLAIDDKSAWANIVSIRHKIKTGKKLEKDEIKFRRENPEYFVWDSKTVEEKRNEADLLDELDIVL